jgi:hypothetical protein
MIGTERFGHTPVRGTYGEQVWRSTVVAIARSAGNPGTLTSTMSWHPGGGWTTTCQLHTVSPVVPTPSARAGRRHSRTLSLLRRPHDHHRDLRARGCAQQYSPDQPGGPRFARDSLLEGTGFEPPVPRKAPGVVVVSVLVRADFSVSLESSRGEMSPSLKTSVVSRGTGGSNPVPSSGESGANLLLIGQ